MAKITFFLPSLAGGGAERVTLTLAGALSKRGHQVDLVLVEAAGPLRDSVPGDVKVVDLGCSRILASVGPLARYLRRARPDVLISAPDITDPVALWAKMLALSRVRVVATAHSNLAASVDDRFRLRWTVFPLLMRVFHRMAHSIVAVSDGTANELARTAHIPRSRIVTIPNPISYDDILRLGCEEVEHPWFVPGEPPVVLAAGRLNAAKDYPTLLRAFAEVRERRPARLLILGDGELREELEALSSSLGLDDDVSLPGFESNPYRYMSRCRAFVLSSAWEGLPLVIPEALACGAQVVSTDCVSGPSEILEQGAYGRLVPIGDVQGLARGIEAALDDPLPVVRLRERAGRYSVEEAADQYLRVAGLD